MTVEELRRHLLELGETERAESARDLLMSLDQHTDDDAATAWLPELQDRSAAYREGTMTATPWREAMERVGTITPTTPSFPRTRTSG